MNAMHQYMLDSYRSSQQHGDRTPPQPGLHDWQVVREVCDYRRLPSVLPSRSAQGRSWRIRSSHSRSSSGRGSPGRSSPGRLRATLARALGLRARRAD
ncbi:hypothetical protein AB0M39_21490 [Streptomyces sp. NPDC051907]|uniref:hypothetical protein n=1 Tax=Streptomyces sp. NPDC051907 TaxID=3155284 RepID=UPI003423D9A4